MKGFLIAAIFSILPASAIAQVVAPRAVTDMEQTFKSTMTCTSILIASGTVAGNNATQVIASTQTLWGSLTIQNKDSSANAFFSESPFVSSGTANGALNPNTGFELAAGTPGASASFYLAPGQLLYGINDSGSRQSVITICKGR